MSSEQPISFGVGPGLLRVSWNDLVAIWRVADEIGFADAWVPDHFYAYLGELDGPVFEAWAALAAMAASTQWLRLGVMVSGNTYRHPAVLANMATTIDHISGGRLELGIGAGWMEVEHEAYGIPLPPVRERLDRLEEAVQVLRLLFTEPRASFPGRYYQLRDALCEPKPLQKPYPPLTIGGKGEKRTLRIAAQYADRWNGDLVVNLRHKIGVLHGHCREVGRDPASIDISVVLRPEEEIYRGEAMIASGHPDVEAERQRLVAAGVGGSALDERLRGAVLEGFLPRDDERAVERLNGYVAQGARHFILLHRPPYDPSYLERFMRNVAPRVAP